MGRTGTRDPTLAALAVLLAAAAGTVAVGPEAPEERPVEPQQQAWWEREPLYAIFALMGGLIVLVITALVLMARR